MIFLVCKQCLAALRTSGDFDEVDHLVGTRSDWYPNRYPCPFGCDGTLQLAESVEGRLLSTLLVYDLTPQECFQALHGLGVPHERECGVGAVADSLKGKSVQSFVLQPIANDNRVVLRSLTLDDGTTVHLGASPQGAIVYRIARPRSVVKGVCNGG